MRIGVVRTSGSPCRCAESVSDGLYSLGHEIVLADSGEIEIQAAALAAKCDLVIDHTDTYCGRGLYRPFVRFLLESNGARVVGSSASACFVADNKAASKEILANAGIPVPPGIVIHSNSWELPAWLNPPLVLKPAYEHMSRGVRLVHTAQEAYREAARMFEMMRQPVLVESFIPGRELAVSLIGNSEELQVFPVLEWQSGTDILTENFKLMDPGEAEHKTVRALLDSELNGELEGLARRAFRVLNLRDYARFDLRLSAEGSIFFLEANTTPSLEPMEALAVSVEWAGLDYAGRVDRLLSAALKRHESAALQKPAVQIIPLPSGSVNLRIPEGMPFPAESTIELARLLDVRQGEDVLELGCGSGLLSIASSKLAARRVVAADIEARALQAMQDNAAGNGAEHVIEVRAGSWFEALPGESRFDVILATPPQTPGSRPFGPKYGGIDGARHLTKIIKRAPAFLKNSQSRLWLVSISLANPQMVWAVLHEHFDEVALIHQTERSFTPAEYEALEEGLFDYLLSLRASGISDFAEEGDGRYHFYNHFIRAARPRRI